MLSGKEFQRYAFVSMCHSKATPVNHRVYFHTLLYWNFVIVNFGTFSVEKLVWYTDSLLSFYEKFWKTLDNNNLNQVVPSSGFSENKGLGGVLSLAGS